MIHVAGRRCWMSLLLLGLAAPLCAVPGSWRALGPDGGSVYDLAFAPSRPQALYAATDGGVYRSLDGGASWSYSNAGLDESPQVSSLAVDPVHPLTVYAAQSGAMYRSLDGGATWLRVSSSFGVFKVVLPVRGSGIVYAMANGLYRSSDGGATWRSLTRGLPASYRPVDLVADPIDPNRLYTAGTDSHVYRAFKSVDGGFTWKRADQGLPAGQAISALAIDPRSPKVLYAGTGDGGVYKSRDGGALWRPLGTLPDGYAEHLWVSRAGTLFAASANRLFRAEGSGRWIDVSQVLPGSVRALLFPPGDTGSLLAGVVTNGARRGGVFASANSGRSWILRSTDISALNVTSVAVAPDALWAVANEILLQSADRGETWKEVQFELVGLATRVAVDPAAPENVYAVVDDGTLWRSRDGGERWEATPCPIRPAARLVFDPGSPSTLYA
ncbi:MAG TPA: hypothetical protein VII86_13955, partial [Thermoanaerobaculia bacterium]